MDAVKSLRRRYFEKAAKQIVAVIGEEALGMELQAEDGPLLVADGHDLAVPSGESAPGTRS